MRLPVVLFALVAFLIGSVTADTRPVPVPPACVGGGTSKNAGCFCQGGCPANTLLGSRAILARHLSPSLISASDLRLVMHSPRRLALGRSRTLRTGPLVWQWICTSPLPVSALIPSPSLLRPRTRATPTSGTPLVLCNLALVILPVLTCGLAPRTVSFFSIATRALALLSLVATTPRLRCTLLHIRRVARRRSSSILRPTVVPSTAAGVILV